MVVGKRKIHIAGMMYTPVNAHIPGLYIIVEILFRSVFHAPFPAMVDTQKVCAACKPTVAVGKVKIVIHKIDTVKYAVDGHQSVTAGFIQTQNLAFFCFHHFFDIVSKISPAEHFPWVRYHFQKHPLFWLGFANLH